MTDVQEFCLRWNNHQSNLVSAFHDLRLGEDFVDVTLACDGRSLQAHKVVLSACSPFFRDLLKTTPCKHPVIVLKDILFRDLVALIEFMYQGEVRVGHDGLPSFLRTAEVLRVRGLTEEASRQNTSQLAFSEPPPTISSQTHNLNTSSPAYSSPQLCQYGSHHVQSDTAHSPANTGVHVSSHWTSSLDEVKVEEVDLDSSSEGGADAEPDVDIDERSSQHHQPQQQPQQHKEMEVSPSDDEDKGRVEQPENDDADEAAPALVPAPCLTLQSFARIPPLVAQDFNPPPVVVPPDFVNPDQLSGPTGPDDRRIAQDLQVSVEQENLVGRTPGRTSTSDRPRWPCPFCLRLLSSRSSVRRHIEDRHTNDNSRHPCPLCERLYRTRNSLQYHLSTAHRDREPGPRGRPRTRPRTPSSNEAVVQSAGIPIGAATDNKNNHDVEAGSRIIAAAHPTTMTLYNLSTRGPPFGLPPT